MKRIVMSVLNVVLCMCLAFTAFTACGTTEIDNPDDEEENKTYSIVLDNSSLEVELGGTVELTATVYLNDEVYDADWAADWSSSDVDVATVTGGVVTGLSTGETVITASYGGASASCTVTVVASYIPQLTLGAGDSTLISVLLYNTYTVSPYILYNGITYTDGTFTYTSGDTSVFTVGDDGMITGIAVGEAQLTILGSWRGFDSQVLSSIYTVTVARDLVISIETPSYTTIAASDLDIDGYDTPNTVQLTASLVIDGEDMTDSALLSWTSSNEGAAIVDESGLVTGVAEGTTYITVSYTDENNEEYCSTSVAISVEFPFVDKTSLGILADIDASEAAGEGDSSLMVSSIFGTVYEVTKVTDVTTATSATEIEFEDNNGVLVIKQSGLNVGERVWEIRTETFAYQITVCVATKIITDADELLAAFGTAATSSSGLVYGTDAYYILGSNIDASGYARDEEYWTSASDTGFMGSFDGRGYTIDGLTLKNGGLFGNLGSTSSVKNFGLTNVTLDNGSRTDYQPAAIAYYIYGGAVVENVFIYISDVTENAATNGSIRAFANMVRDNSSTVTDVVLAVAFTQDVLTKTGSSFLTKIESGNYGLFTNVSVISDMYLFTSTDTSSTVDVSGLTRYETASDYADAYSSLDATGLSSDYWTLSSDIGYPVFTTYFNDFYGASIDKALTALETEVTYDIGTGGIYTVSDACGNVEIALSAEITGVTVSDGSVIVGEDAVAGSFTFTVTSAVTGTSVTVSVTILSKAQIAAREASAAFEELAADTTVIEYSVGVEYTWSPDTETLGDVTLTLSDDAPSGVSVSGETLTISADAEAGTFSVTVKSSFYMDEEDNYLTAVVYFELLNESSEDATQIELSQDSSDDLNVLSNDAFTDESTGSVAYKLVSSESYTTISASTYTNTFSNGTLTLDSDFLSSLEMAGEYNFRVQLVGKVIEFTNVFLYTDIITDAEELMEAFGSNVATSSSGSAYGTGTYYVLGNNIDAGETTRPEEYWTSASDTGFMGTFDGRGYTIDGLTVSNGGLFGNLGSTAVVQNFALTNVTIDGSRWQPSVIAYNIYSEAVIENVFVYVTDVTENCQSGGSIRVFANVLKGNLTNGTYPTISNVVVVTDFDGTFSTADPIGFATSYSTGNYAALSNVYVISDYYLFNGTDSGSSVTLTGLIRFGSNATYSAFTDLYTSLDNTGLDADYWTLDSALGYPVFTSAHLTDGSIGISA